MTKSPPSVLLEKSKSLMHSKYETLIKYTLVPSIPLSIIAILSINPNTWVASEIHHFYIELFAVILAAVLAFYYILRASTLNYNFFYMPVLECNRRRRRRRSQIIAYYLDNGNLM